MKKILVIFILFISVWVYAEDTVTVPVSFLEDMKAQINADQEEINSLRADVERLTSEVEKRDSIIDDYRNNVVPKYKDVLVNYRNELSDAKSSIKAMSGFKLGADVQYPLGLIIRGEYLFEAGFGISTGVGFDGELFGVLGFYFDM